MSTPKSWRETQATAGSSSSSEIPAIFFHEIGAKETELRELRVENQRLLEKCEGGGATYTEERRAPVAGRGR